MSSEKPATDEKFAVGDYVELGLDFPPVYNTVSREFGVITSVYSSGWAYVRTLDPKTRAIPEEEGGVTMWNLLFAKRVSDRVLRVIKNGSLGRAHKLMSE